MTLRELMRGSLYRALVAEVPAIRVGDIGTSSTLYDRPRTARGVSPAHFQVPRTLTTLRRIYREASRTSLGRLGSPAGSLRRLTPTEEGLYFDRVVELTRWMTELAGLQLRAIALRTGARAAGLAADAPARSPLDTSSSDEREQLVRGVERQLARLVGQRASGLSTSEAGKVRRAETVGALIPVIAKKLEAFLTQE